jgi:anti-sigma-K factor RskA
MSANHHDPVRLLPAYALGCLDDEDALRLRQHLETCLYCHAEWYQYQAVVDQLALAAPDAIPSRSLRRRLLAGVLAKKISTRSHLMTSWRLYLSAFHQYVTAALRWQLASLLLIVALAVSSLSLWRHVHLVESQMPATMTTTTLFGKAAAQEAGGLIIASANGHSGTLVVDRLPVLNEAAQYQLWLTQADGQRISGGIFSVNGDGYHSLFVTLERPLAEYIAFGVTVEPAGGSPAPTGRQVLCNSQPASTMTLSGK